MLSGSAALRIGIPVAGVLAILAIIAVPIIRDQQEIRRETEALARVRTLLIGTPEERSEAQGRAGLGQVRVARQLEVEKRERRWNAVSESLKWKIRAPGDKCIGPKSSVTLSTSDQWQVEVNLPIGWKRHVSDARALRNVALEIRDLIIDTDNSDESKIEIRFLVPTGDVVLRSDNSDSTGFWISEFWI